MLMNENGQMYFAPKDEISVKDVERLLDAEDRLWKQIEQIERRDALLDEKGPVDGVHVIH